jgi:hypothetical protein
MSEREGTSAAVQPVRANGEPRSRTLIPAETAWIALIPCGILMLATIMLVGPPLGRTLFRPGTGADVLWPPGWWEAGGNHEPVKHGRYILAVVAPLVLALAIFALARVRPRLQPRVIRGLVLAGQASVLAFVVVGVLGERHVFSGRELAIAAALVAVGAVACRRERAVTWVTELARERRLVRIASFAIAAAFAAMWVIEIVRNDGLTEDYGKMNWIPNGAYAVLDGRTPLVDVHIIYAKLLPYPAALVMATFGGTALVFSVFLAVLNLAALLAVYAIYRRIVGSVFALGLFLPFVALSDAIHLLPFGSIWPMRYGNAYLLAWLTARHIDRRSPRHLWVLFFVGGLTMIDMFDFGFAATLATIAALLFARPPQSARDVWPLVRAVAIGVLGAVSAVTIFTLVRAGEPPRFGLLFEWSRIFTGLGWFSLPLPLPGLAFAIYATFAAAIVVAAVRVVRHANDVLLTGMLIWIGVLGLVGGNYYVVRPDTIKLVAMFSAWGFALGLLTIVSVRALTARDWRSPTLAELLVLFGFALSVCMIGRLDSPLQPIRDLSLASEPTYRPMAKELVAAHTHRGEKVAILLPESYRIAYELGLDNVSPYELQNALVTLRQIQTEIEVIEREGVRALFTPAPGAYLIGDVEAAPEHMELFRRAGFQAIERVNQMIAWRKPGPGDRSARDEGPRLLP